MKTAVKTTQFFFYGIFIDANMRRLYNLPEEASYATVDDYATYKKYSTIVEAVETPGATLTGVIVNVSEENIPALDRIEAGYNRIEVETSQGDAQMYVKPIS